MTEPLPWLAKCVRPMLRAAPGRIFRGADLSNIEGRVNAWLAGEQWKLDAFVLQDMGGPGIYETTAAGIVGVSIDKVTKAQRQAQGKVPELACGYQGGVMAFISMAANYNTKPEDVADVAASTADPAVWAKTLARYTPQFGCGLAPEVWTGVKLVVDGWRARHPAIVQSWWDLQDAAVEAASTPGAIISVLNGKIRYLSAKGFLWCMLPSGRLMSYPKPRVVRSKRSVVKRYPRDPTACYEAEAEFVGVTSTDEWDFVEYERWTNACEVWGITAGQWLPYTLHGGLQAQNNCEGVARDVLAGAMIRMDRAGYDLILHAHDEVLTECKLDFGSCKELEDLLSQGESWTTGLPLAAKAWEDERYVK